jgi:hypothetical protein
VEALVEPVDLRAVILLAAAVVPEGIQEMVEEPVLPEMVEAQLEGSMVEVIH